MWNDTHMGSQRMKVWTIGHSRHEFGEFAKLLEQNSIEVVVDVRTIPSSKMAPQFNEIALRKALEERNLEYIFMGKELGGRPDGAHMYDEKGHVLYNKLAESDLFNAGIERLLNGISKYRVAIMCSEGKPEGCHRHLLISRVLQESNVEVFHILTDGSLIAYQELAKEDNQIALIELEGGEPWKSVLSVRQVSQQNDFFEP